MSRVSRPLGGGLLALLGVIVVGSAMSNTGSAAGMSITAARFYVESLTTTPGVALQDTFGGNGSMNGRGVPTIDPDGGTTFGTTTTNRPTWTAADATWTTASSRALHGASGAPSVASIPWLSRSSYVQVRFPVVATTSNAGLGILCDAATSCIGARLRRSGGNYVLELGTLSSGTFTVAASPTCTTTSCTVTVGGTVPTTTDLRLTYTASTYAVQLTFGSLSATMTAPSGYRTNTRAGLFALANSDGTRFGRFQVGSL